MKSLLQQMDTASFRLERQTDYGSAEQNRAVQEILAAVKTDGDQALTRYTKLHDGVDVLEWRVAEEVLQSAYERVDQGFVETIRRALANIRKFHEHQKQKSWMDLRPDGSILGQIVRPLKRVGIYVPGGKAAYPSSVLMNVVPAQTAGVEQIVMVTPPATNGQSGVNPYVLVAAQEAGVKEIYQVGGAQAIAALAYGTNSIPAVDKIVGPGNIYVALAKRYVYGVVDIDSIAGPSEIAVLADEHADPAYVAADLLSQAEHDEMASSILITTSPRLAEQVNQELHRQLADLPRKAIAEQSLADHGALVLVASLQEGIEVVNRLAPEHLEVMTQHPHDLLGAIENAGAIFLGPYSSEPVGDYYAGPNHILPTNGTARFSSSLQTADFYKSSSLISWSREALLASADDIMSLARQEGLEAHARAIALRVEQEGMNNS